jgi:hypothetical protein
MSPRSGIASGRVPVDSPDIHQISLPCLADIGIARTLLLERNKALGCSSNRPLYAWSLSLPPLGISIDLQSGIKPLRVKARRLQDARRTRDHFYLCAAVAMDNPIETCTVSLPSNPDLGAQCQVDGHSIGAIH